MKIIKNYRLQFSKIISNYNDYLYSISLILNYMTKGKQSLYFLLAYLILIDFQSGLFYLTCFKLSVQ